MQGFRIFYRHNVTISTKAVATGKHSKSNQDFLFLKHLWNFCKLDILISNYTIFFCSKCKNHFVLCSSVGIDKRVLKKSWPSFTSLLDTKTVWRLALCGLNKFWKKFLLSLITIPTLHFELFTVCDIKLYGIAYSHYRGRLCTNR